MPSSKKNRKNKKSTEIREYEIALVKLRESVRKTFHQPLERQKLNLSLMYSIKVKNAL